MAAIWEKVKGNGLKAKLKAEIAFVDLQITKRQKAFGVAFYDALEAQKTPFKLPSDLFPVTESQIQGPLEICRQDVAMLYDQKTLKQTEMERIQVKRDRETYAHTPQEKVMRFGQNMADTSTETKIKGEIMLLDRQMKVRKEAFGVEVFDLVASDIQKKSDGGMGSGALKISNLVGAGDKKSLELVVQEAKSEIATMKSKRTEKERDVLRVDEK